MMFRIIVFCASTLLFGYIAAEKLVMPDYLRGPSAILQHTCQVETGLTDDVIKKIHSGKLPNEREFQCHLHCMMDKVGLYADDGSFDFDLIWHVVPEEFKPQLSVAIDTCKTIHGADQCETAFLTISCYTKTDPDIDIAEWFTKESRR